MNKKKKITNTTQEVFNNPILGIFHSLPGHIEASERNGAREAVQSTQLPADPGAYWT